jgi:hypothetical protein
MSADKDQMTRSHVAMLDHVRRRFPETPTKVLASSEAVVRARNAVARARRLRLGGGASELWQALRLDPRTGAEAAADAATDLIRGAFERRFAKLFPSPSRPQQFFYDSDPRTGPRAGRRSLLDRQLIQLSKRDEEYFREGCGHLHLARRDDPEVPNSSGRAPDGIRRVMPS